MTIDWPKIWQRLSEAEKQGVETIDVLPEENVAINKIYDDFAALAKKMRPKEGQPPEAQRQSDREFRAFMAGQFKTYQHIKRIEP